jgi:hypothetical protein
VISPGIRRRAKVGEAGVAALVFVFVLAHLPSLPESLEDIDSVNFALGVRDFDVARHRPHPPGYPVYIAAAKAAVGAGTLVDGDSADPSSPGRAALEARALALLSLAGAIVAIVCLYRFFCCFARTSGDRIGRPWRELDARALAATALTAACPLFWYMSVRPMSDVPGLAASLAALVCLGLAWWRQQPSGDGDRRLDAAHLGASGRMIVLGSLLAAVAIGVRSQNAMLTVPFLLAVLADRIGRGVAGAMIGATFAFVAGGLLWGVPLLMASGGLESYLAALGQQAGEDFAGVEMLYLNPSPRLAANALLSTLIYPWDSLLLGGVVVTLAVIGAGSLLVRDRRTLAALTAVSVPYLLFHLLFQDMDFVRYALPLVPVVAFLALCGLDLVSGRFALPISGALTVWAVAIASPVLYAYGSESSPVARAVQAMREDPAEADRAVLAAHQTFQRPLEAEVVPVQVRLPSPPRREWLELARYWREGNTAPIWFLADPRRTDLALIDPRSRADRRDFSWRFSSLSQIGGMRPAALQWYRLSPPGWFADEGWALTPETAGISRAMQRGPHLGPIIAWVRRRADAAQVLIGGRHLGGPQNPPVTFTMTVDGRPAAKWQADPGFFLQVFNLPAGSLAGGDSPARLGVSSTVASGGSVPTAIEQFDLQTAGALMWGFGEGWHEAEYNPRVGLWRWASERAALRIINAETPVSVRLQIESPLRYFETSPAVKVSVAGRVLSEIRPAGDTVMEVTVPPDALRDAGGLVVVETDRMFVPAERDGVPDQRRLGLRVFGVSVTVPN